MIRIPVFNAEDFVADFGIASGVPVGHFTTDHSADDALLGDFVFLHPKRFNDLTVSNDGCGVGDGLHFVELVGDDDRGDAAFFQHTQQIQQVGRVFVVKR